jgi:hypothetical protein
MIQRTKPDYLWHLIHGSHVYVTVFVAHKQKETVTTYFMLVSCLAYSSTLKMEATYSSEISVAFSRVHGVISQKIELFMEKIIF